MIQPSSLAFLEFLLLRCIGGVTFELPLRGTWVASGAPNSESREPEALKDVMLRSYKNQHTTILWNIREYPKLLRLANQNQSSTEHRLEKMAPTFS
jgi:antirestriction protein